MRDVLNSVAAIFFLASFSSAGQKMDMKVFDSQSVWEIPLDKGFRFCEFSQDGKVLWVVGDGATANCYEIAERRMMPPEDFATASQPLSRLKWRRELADVANFELIVENKKGLKLPPDILSSGKADVCLFQLSPTGMPVCVDFQDWEDGRRCGVFLRRTLKEPIVKRFTLLDLNFLGFSSLKTDGGVA